MKKDVTVILLAAGVGKRFVPFVTDKSVFPWSGEPLMLRNLKKLMAAGFHRFIVVTNPSNDSIIRTHAPRDIEISTVIQKSPSGMGDALKTVEDAVKGSPIFVVNAEDVVDDSLYGTMYQAVNKAEGFVVGKKMHEYFDGGYLKVSGDRLIGIVEKPGKGNEPGTLVNLVFHYFPRADEFLSGLRSVETTHDDLYEQALDSYIKSFPVRVLTYDGFWSPLKYPWHVLDILPHFLAHDIEPGRGKHVEIRNNVSIEGSVYIGNNVRIFENTKLVGPLYIGDNTIIGNNNIIRESVIGERCVTGFSTDIARSYIGDNCWFHSNYIGDSVLEGNVSLGSGAVLANLRLDEGPIQSYVSGLRMDTRKNKLGSMIARNVRVGVNASIMPGVKIGTNSFVGAGVVLDADLAPDSFCYTKPSYDVKRNTATIASFDRTTYKSKI